WLNPSALPCSRNRPIDIGLQQRLIPRSYDRREHVSVMLPSPRETFTVADLHQLSELVAETWTSGRDRDWSSSAGTIEWSCVRMAEHAVDCVYAPAFFLASRS